MFSGRPRPSLAVAIDLGPARPLPPRTSCFPDPVGAGLALFALNQPGLCVQESRALRAREGSRERGGWVGAGVGGEAEDAELEGRERGSGGGRRRDR